MERKNRRLWVAFTGKTDIWYLKFLNKEFRHCFIILDDVNHWITIDPLSSSTEIEVINKKDYSQDLPSWFQEIGFKLVETKFYIPSAKAIPLRLLNCVEIAKNIIGIQNFFILTPYQLFKFLNQNKRKERKYNMGSLFSSPKRPNIRPIVNSSTQNKAIEVNPATAVIESGNVNKIRENNLLKRSRGTTGTILTGFNGILGDQAESIPQKKLLGE